MEHINELLLVVAEDGPRERMQLYQGMPLLGPPSQLDNLMHFGRALAAEQGRTFKVVRFSARADVAVLPPPAKEVQ